jgi:hypothetical protein
LKLLVLSAADVQRLLPMASASKSWRRRSAISRAGASSSRYA